MGRAIELRKADGTGCRLRSGRRGCTLPVRQHPSEATSEERMLSKEIGKDRNSQMLFRGLGEQANAVR